MLLDRTEDKYLDMDGTILMFADDTTVIGLICWDKATYVQSSRRMLQPQPPFEATRPEIILEVSRERTLHQPYNISL